MSAAAAKKKAAAASAAAAAAAAEQSASGTVVEADGCRYQVGEMVGKGAYGSVYKGLNLETADFVAIKQVRIKNVPKGELASLKMEIELLQKLNHPNIVKYIGSSVTTDHLIIVLELIEGGSLAHIVKRFGGRLPESLVAIYTAQLLQGLIYLHAQGVLHRDVKGANLLTTKDGRVALADFGVSAFADSDEAESVIGSPYWMAVEVIEMCGATSKSDIWSVGCTVIELLTGKPPHYDLQPMQAMFRIVSDDCPPLPDSITPALRDFLLQTFIREPALRASALKLSTHPWIVKNARTRPDAPANALPSSSSSSALDATVSIGGAASLSDAAKPAERLAAAAEDAEDDDWSKDFDEDERKSTLKMKASPQPADVLDFDASRSNTLVGQLSVRSGGDGGTSTSSSAATKSTGFASSKPATPKPAKPAAADSPGRPKLLPAQLASSPRHVVVGSGPAGSSHTSPSPLRGANNAQSAGAIPSQPSSGGGGGGGGGGGSRIGNRRAVAGSAIVSRLSAPTSAGGSLLVGNPQGLSAYAEEEDDDNWDEFDATAGSLQLMLVDGMMTRSASGDSQQSQSVSASSAPLLAGGSMLQNAAGEGAADNDPFAFDLEEDELGGSDVAARDEYLRTASEVHSLFSLLRGDQPEVAVVEACDQLLSLFLLHPDQRTQFVRRHGTLAILNAVDMPDRPVALRAALKVVNAMIDNNPAVQESLCLVGVIPIIMPYASPDYPKPVRVEAARFVQQMCRTSALTLQMFIASRGLPVLVELLSVDYNENRELVWLALDCVHAVFALQSHTPKNDFCSLLTKFGLLDRLSQVLRQLVADPEAPEYCDRVAAVLVQFSTASVNVKQAMSALPVIKRILAVLPRVPRPMLVNLLKSIKNLTMGNVEVLGALQRGGVIHALTSLLARASGMTDVENLLLASLYHLLRLNRERQELAVGAGAVPHLLRTAHSNSPFRQFSIPLLAEFAHAKRCRPVLLEAGAVGFYVSLMTDGYWCVSACEALASWLSDDAPTLEPSLRAGSAQLACAFAHPTTTIVKVLPPMLRMLSLSTALAVALTAAGLVRKVADWLVRLSGGDGGAGAGSGAWTQNAEHAANAQINLLKVLRLLVDSQSEPGARARLVQENNLLVVVRALGGAGGAVIVETMASQLMEQWQQA